MRMTIDEFFERFNPQENHLCPNTPYENTLFETFGKEVEYIQEQRKFTPRNLWTLIDVDEKLVIIPGYWHVNRLGYFITKKEWTIKEFNELEILDK